jgi:uncharacterized tellurite resistance protein B-like protein
MRHYPQNIPLAGARILALAALSDGNLSRIEVDTLDRLKAHDQLGMERAEMIGVINTLCEDLLATAHGDCQEACRVDECTLSELMAEVDDPDFRLKLLHLCAAVVESDNYLAEGESIVMGAAVEHWGMHRAML